MGVDLICLRECGSGRITRSLEGEGHFLGEHRGEGYARQREQYAQKLVD